MTVGIQGKAALEAHGSVSIVDLGAIHEFGLGDNPERSWLRGWFDENLPALEADIRNVSRQVLLGRMTTEHGLDLLGQKYVGQIQKRMAESIPPPLKPATIRRKGSSTTLIDTGQLRSSISYLLHDVAKANPSLFERASSVANARTAARANGSGPPGRDPTTGRFVGRA